MKIKKQIALLHKIWQLGVIFLAVITPFFGTGSLLHVKAQYPTSETTYHVLADGQFVYGPNIGDFNLKDYLRANAPHLLKYADDLYGRSEYNSVNPKIYLTLLEIQSRLISMPENAPVENPFDLNSGDFISQIDYLSEKMTEAYYLHLYSYSAYPPSQRNLPPFVTPGGATIMVSPGTNAGTYAIIAGLAAIDEQNISLILDNSRPNGFHQTYIRLFGDDDPLDDKNHIHVPGQVGALTVPPDSFLQLPFLQGLSWRFGGVHNTSGGSVFTDASSLDFYPGGSAWGMDTSGMWVVAAASGIPTRLSDCGFKISHSGALNVGWETTYYHLEGAKYISGSINQNDKIGVIANTLAEATCTGGAASGPHVHFSLKYNGAYVAINGTPLSGWYIHSGRYSYDVDHNYMWLERAGFKKYPYSDVVLSEAPPSSGIFADVSMGHWAWSWIEGFYSRGITTGCVANPLQYCPDREVTRSEMAVFVLRAKNGSLYQPPAQSGTFADVPVAGKEWMMAWVEQFYDDGLTTGCALNPLRYCPERNVTRGEMAVFLLRARNGATYQPPAVTSPIFADVPISGKEWMQTWIEEFYRQGYTTGCGVSPLRYCAERNVTRAEMAVFISRVFNIPPLQ